MAEERGFYDDEGLDVTILRGGPNAPALQWLHEGRADFATAFLSSALQEYSESKAIVNVAQIVQESSLILVAKADSGIQSPADFEGRRISLWPAFSTQPLALFRAYGVTPEIVPQHQTLNAFLRGAVDVASAMWYNEYHTLIKSGLNEEELQAFFFQDYNLNFPEDGVYCLRYRLVSDPETVRAFVQASLRGWVYAFDHPDETLNVVMRHIHEANIPSNRVHQQWMLERMRDVILPDNNERILGQLREADYHTVASEMLRVDLIDSIPDFQVFHENYSER